MVRLQVYRHGFRRRPSTGVTTLPPCDRLLPLRPDPLGAGKGSWGGGVCDDSLPAMSRAVRHVSKSERYHSSRIRKASARTVNRNVRETVTKESSSLLTP